LTSDKTQVITGAYVWISSWVRGMASCVSRGVGQCSSDQFSSLMLVDLRGPCPSVRPWPTTINAKKMCNVFLTFELKSRVNTTLPNLAPGIRASQKYITMCIVSYLNYKHLWLVRRLDFFRLRFWTASTSGSVVQQQAGGAGG